MNQLHKHCESNGRVVWIKSLNDHCVINVKYPSMGTVCRLFEPKSSFDRVYDWIGSFSKYPMCFDLFAHEKSIIDSNGKVENYCNIALTSKSVKVQ